MSKSQRDKGAGYERELCAYFSDRLGRVVKRNIGQARDGGDDITIGKFRIEAKRRKRIGNIYGWRQQVIEASQPEDMPVVICRGDGKESLVILGLDDFTYLLRGELA